MFISASTILSYQVHLGFMPPFREKNTTHTLKITINTPHHQPLLIERDRLKKGQSNPLNQAKMRKIPIFIGGGGDDDDGD